MRTTTSTALVLAGLLLAGCVSAAEPTGPQAVPGGAPTTVDGAESTTTAPAPADAAGRTTKAPATAGAPDVVAELPRLVDAEDADLVLHVSNQVPTEEVVEITVAVDGEELIEESFAFEEGHNWIEFGIELPPGEHTLTATSGTGAGTERSFELPVGEQRWAVLNYWSEPTDESESEMRRFFTVEVTEEFQPWA